MDNETFNSYVVIVTNPDNGETNQTAMWEVESCDTNEALYRHAMAEAARMVATVGSGAALVHIELFNA